LVAPVKTSSLVSIFLPTLSGFAFQRAILWAAS
jgi:hypothetical protein